MSGFFYTTGAGAADFAALVIVAALGVTFGLRYIKALSLTMCAVFLLERTALHFTSDKLLMLATCAASFSGIVYIGLNYRNRTAISFAVLYALKMAAYTLHLVGALSFGSMTAWATVAVYAQLLLILGGAANGSGGWLSRRVDYVRRGVSLGDRNTLVPLADRCAILARSLLPFSGVSRPPAFRKKGRKVAQ